MFKVSALAGFGAGQKAVAIVVENNGNVDSTDGTSITFSAKPVGSGGGRSIILMCSAEDENFDTAEITTCTVDGTSCDRRVEHGKTGSGKVNHTAIFTLKLTTESGNVDIVLGSANTMDSWGLSYIVVTGLNSEVPTDSAVGDATATPVASGTTLDGLAGGVAVGVTGNALETSTHSWGSSLTEQADLQTGAGTGDHVHAAAYDLLPGGRAASTETVTFTGGTTRIALSTATFR